MAYRMIGLILVGAGLSACSVDTLGSFPTPGSYNPLETVQPIDTGMVAVGREVGEIHETIEEGRESGAISRREGRALGRSAGAIADAAERMGADGLSADEQRALETQARIVKSQAEAAKIIDPAPTLPKPKRD